MLPHLSPCQMCHCSCLSLTGLYDHNYVYIFKKSPVLTLDFTTNPLQQEHEQLHSTTPPPKPARFVAPDKRALNKCACTHDRLEKCVRWVNTVAGPRMCTEQLHASLL